ncbi:hypothetical protein BACPLE_01000 [Phocaeicola plebeius DSM 17135]|uniref:Uncharacterized protein n=1 Tax=Phocaeicola plebeius (strain DSM 17135 / JCM 12973 / CCUG 54634 / M2) TaxID=484018 RepID=B5CWB0_PHOPM|nr:hypothetical protein BACPLE_01000 [Phocaeicola plebeius DSM 17135]
MFKPVLCLSTAGRTFPWAEPYVSHTGNVGFCLGKHSFCRMIFK